MQLLCDVPASRHARLRCFLVPAHAADIPTGGLLEMELHLVMIVWLLGGFNICLTIKSRKCQQLKPYGVREL